MNMGINNELKEIDINWYYFDDTSKIENFDPGNILIDEKSYKIF